MKATISKKVPKKCKRCDIDFNNTQNRRIVYFESSKSKKYKVICMKCSWRKTILKFDLKKAS
jgi:hypothetical protein